MMGDTRALQSGTSHYLGDNFARAFEIRYLDRDNTLQYCWTTSWGLSTRFVGAVIMVHGDDRGLILPPRLAPYQVVVVPIFRSAQEREGVMEAVERVRRSLADFRVWVDLREEVTPGYKFNDWEMRGVPLRLEIGPRDVAEGTVALARRDVPGKEGKTVVRQEGLPAVVGDRLAEIQRSLYDRALSFRKDHTHLPGSYDEFRQSVQQGWAEAWWCGEPECELQIKEDTKATTRVIPFDQPGGAGPCIRCSRPAKERAVFARAY
jgi:prolyl-tRNA synthetase